MAGTNRMLEGLKRNGESRGAVMNFLATQGLKKTMCNKERKRVVSLNRNKRSEARVCFQILASYFTNYPLSVGYSSTAACAAATRAIGTRNGEQLT